MQFTPLKDFYSEDFKSQYLVGFSYNATDEKLLEHVNEWVARGFVRLGSPDTLTEAKVSGAGEVK